MIFELICIVGTVISIFMCLYGKLIQTQNHEYCHAETFRKCTGKNCYIVLGRGIRQEKNKKSYEMNWKKNRMISIDGIPCYISKDAIITCMFNKGNGFFNSRHRKHTDISEEEIRKVAIAPYEIFKNEFIPKYRKRFLLTLPPLVATFLLFIYYVSKNGVNLSTILIVALLWVLMPISIYYLAIFVFSDLSLSSFCKEKYCSNNFGNDRYYYEHPEKWYIDDDNA